MKKILLATLLIAAIVATVILLRPKQEKFEDPTFPLNIPEGVLI